MLPAIIVYRDREKIEPYTNLYVKENAIPKNNIFSLIPEKRQLSIDQIREMKKQIGIASPTKRLFVLYEFDAASPPAQNALLKTLEEKREDDYFLLFVTQLELVLSTIRSRCNVIYIEPNTARDVSPEMKDFVKSLFQKTPVLSFSSSLVTGMTQEKGIIFLDELALAVRQEMLVHPSKGSDLLKHILITKSLLQSNNLNPQLAIDSLLLKTEART